jgi:hypothetical protein
MRRGMYRTAAVLAALAGSWLCAVQASAETPATPGYTINTYPAPTIFSPESGGSKPDYYMIWVRNSGSVATNGSPITITDTLPPGVSATEVEATNFVSDEGLLPCVERTVTCTYDAALQPGETLIMRVKVQVAPGTQSPVVNTAVVSGGGALQTSSVQSTVLGTAAQSLAAPFGFGSFYDQVAGADGLTDIQAGDHPFETTVGFTTSTAYLKRNSTVDFNETGPFSTGGLPGYAGEIKDFVIDLPPGFVGNPQVTPKCPQYQVTAEGTASGGGAGAAALHCPPQSQIGVATIDLEPISLRGTSAVKLGFSLTALQTEPIYNMVPDKGYPAEFAFQVAGAPVTLLVNLNQETNYGVRVIVPNVPGVSGIVGITTTFFGTPSTDEDFENPSLGKGGPVAFLDDPVDCADGPQIAKVSMDSWEHPGAWLADGQPDLSEPNWAHTTATTYPSHVGCNLLPYNPALEVLPDTTQADEPSGLAVHLKIPQAQQQAPLLITPELKNVTVTLPQGLSISPSAGEGLQGCSDEQIGLASPSAGACPLASVLGTVKIATPLLTEPLTGQVFLGTPNCNPCSNADAADGNMFRIFIEAAGSGVIVKKQGTIYANPVTGQLTTTFTNNPQLPFGELELRFKSGLRAPLAMPETCGTYTTSTNMEPWSAPITPNANPVSQFNVDWDGHGGACPATLPFQPTFSAGTSNANAGQYSPLTVTFSREDREQDLAALQVKTPPGLLGTLTGLPLCGEPQADLGTCSEASKIGTMTVAAGPGGHPFYTKGALYLTGPYGGAPFGLSIVVPTVAGPFNLGNVVVRAKITIDPHTTALTVTSDPFPQVLDGIPLRLRTANVTIDRPGFIFNPTDCALLHVEATMTGAQGGVSHSSVPFAVSGCHGLAFGPKFNTYTSGRTSRADGASLYAKLVYPTGPQSNVSHVKVELPKALPSRLTTLQKACPSATFEANPASCPAASVIGLAKATTPVLPTPLTGPAYFVSHGGEAFPNLVVILQGYGVRIDVVANTFISKEGITSSTFENVPDVQVSSFELYLPEGPDSALAANGNLCKQQLVMPATFTAQDGAALKENVKIKVTGCPKATAAKKASKARKAAKARRASHRQDGQGRGKR